MTPLSGSEAASDVRHVDAFTPRPDKPSAVNPTDKITLRNQINCLLTAPLVI